MSKDGFTIFSSAHISREEYTGWLHQLNAVMISEEGGPYDARLSKDVRHVWISLLEKKWFDRTLAEFEDSPEALANICQLLDGEPRSAIVLVANGVRGSQILAVKFAALCAEHYPCVVEQSAGEALFPAEEVLQLRDAGMGFDGLTWKTANTPQYDWEAQIVEEEKKRIQQGDNTSSERTMLPAFDASEGQHQEQLGA